MHLKSLKRKKFCCLLYLHLTFPNKKFILRGTNNGREDDGAKVQLGGCEIVALGVSARPRLFEAKQKIGCGWRADTSDSVDAEGFDVADSNTFCES